VHGRRQRSWVGPGKYPILHASKDGLVDRGVLELLHHRVNLGVPTFFVKVRAHGGEAYNEAADRVLLAQKWVQKTLICLAPFGDSTNISVFGLGDFGVECCLRIFVTTSPLRHTSPGPKPETCHLPKLSPVFHTFSR
jgi:hypothetical protein